MTVRAVEGKLPYTGGVAIDIDENKVISLRLRDENNLIIWDEGDNEIYVDLQLPNEITPTDAFPVGITTGRVIIDNGWDSTGTLICAKTTSGDNIKVFYADDGKLYVDNGTGLFTQVYLKPEVDALLQQLRTYVDTELAKKQDKLIAGDNIEIASDGKTISAILPPLSRFLSLWDCSTGEPISFPASIPFEYETGDHYLVNTVDNTTNYRPDGTEWDGVASTTVETSVVAEGDMYIYDGIKWLLQHNQPGGGGSVISVNGQTGVVTLDADDISDSTTANKFVTATDKTTWDGKVAVSTDTGNELSPGAKIWLGTTADFSSIVTPDSNTMYIQYTSSGGGGWQPGANTIAYYPLDSTNTINDLSGNNYNLSNNGATFGTYGGVSCVYLDTTDSKKLYTSISLTGNPTFTVNVRIQRLGDGMADGSQIFVIGSIGSNAKCLGLTIRKSNSQYWAWSWGLTDVTSTATNTMNAWEMITVTKSGSDVVIYQNGVQIASGSLTTSITSNDFTIGSWNIDNSGYQSFYCYMSKFILEDKAWTATEISDYFNQTKSDYGIS